MSQQAQSNGKCTRSRTHRDERKVIFHLRSAKYRVVVTFG